MNAVKNVLSIFGFIGFLLLQLNAWAQHTITKVACIGNSVTYGYGISDREKEAYPEQLQKMLGNRYEVKTLGIAAQLY